MGLFKKTDYDELYRRLTGEELTFNDKKKIGKEIEKLKKNGDKRGYLWAPLLSAQYKDGYYIYTRLDELKSKYGEADYISVLSEGVVIGALKEIYEKYTNPRGTVLLALAYENGWGVERGHDKAVEIIGAMEAYDVKNYADIKESKDIIATVFKQITGREYVFPTKEQVNNDTQQRDDIENSPAEIGEKEEEKTGRVVFDNGDIYEGQRKDGKRNGRGRYTWANGDYYEGEWKDGRKNGSGAMYCYAKRPDGEVYLEHSYNGEWKDDKMHGHGVYSEGDKGYTYLAKVYECEWIENSMHGRVVWYYEYPDRSRGKTYIDFYDNGKLLETCIPYDESIKTVEDARRFRQSQEAKTQATPGAVPESSGEYNARKINLNIVAGEGYYDGDYEYGTRHGYGECNFDDGGKYSGAWSYGNADGVGRYDFADGGFYFGQFSDGIVDGYGIYFDGSDYHIGEFKNGECITERDIYSKIGSAGKWLPLDRENGIWIYGNASDSSSAIIKSRGYIEYSENNPFRTAKFNNADGILKMGRQPGKGVPIDDANGVLISLDQFVATGEIRNGMLNGRVMLVYITGERIEAQCTDGKPTGVYRRWNKMGEEL